MAVDGTTTLGGDNSLNVSDLTDPGWGPGQFQAYQLRDYLDIRAFYSGSGEARSIMRLWSNLEAHLYGELILHDGAIRSFNTMSLACVTDDEDIVSFRAGTNTGRQVARILQNGSYQIYYSGLAVTLSPPDDDASPAVPANLRFYSPALIKAATAGDLSRPVTVDGAQVILNAGASTASQWGFLDKVSSVAQLKAYSDATTPQALSIFSSALYINVGSGSTQQWGYFEFASSKANLKVFAAGGGAQDFALYMSKAFFYAGSGDVASFSSSGTEVSQITNDGSYRIFSGGNPLTKLGIAELRFYADFTIKGLNVSGTTYRSATVEAQDFLLKVDNGGSLSGWGKFLTTSDVRKLTINDVGTAKEFQIEADKLTFRDTGGSPATWGSLHVHSSKSLLEAALPLTINAYSTGYEDIAITGADLNLTTKGSGSVLNIIDDGATTRLSFNQSAELTLTAPSATSAILSLDATTGGGKLWKVVSSYSDDEMKLLNSTDTVVVRITPVGSVVAARYLQPAAIDTSVSMPGDGTKGTIFIDDDGTTLWVHNGTTWKSIPL